MASQAANYSHRRSESAGHFSFGSSRAVSCHNDRAYLSSWVNCAWQKIFSSLQVRSLWNPYMFSCLTNELYLECRKYSGSTCFSNRSMLCSRNPRLIGHHSITSWFLGSYRHSNEYLQNSEELAGKLCHWVRFSIVKHSDINGRRQIYITRCKECKHEQKHWAQLPVTCYVRFSSFRM